VDQSEVVAFWRHHKDVWNASNATEMTSAANGMEFIEVITVGRKSGEKRSVLLSSFRSDGKWLIAASNIGRDTDPNWWQNLKVAGRHGKIRVGGGQILDVEAVELEGEDRTKAWERFTTAEPSYQAYESTTTRRIPVIELRPIDA
jgi:deazaflavin-dependent oxidoreductase (nitroreductase family)